MQSYTDCIPCFVQQAHDALRQVTTEDEELVRRTLQRVMRAAAEFPLSQTPPAMAQLTHRIIREETGNPDPYAKIKAKSNRLALNLAEEVRRIINASVDPFLMALRFSIAGNIMDFALTSKWNLFELDAFIEDTRFRALEKEPVERLRTAVKSARSILMLGDNAGETVFDKLLIEQLGGAEVFYAVKGAPIINDATRADALVAGLDAVAKIVENGSDAPGTMLEDCSASFRGLFSEAGLVIAKGQANYETLSNCSRPIFFLTRVKCPVIGRDLGEPLGSWVVKEHQVESRNVQGPKSMIRDLSTFNFRPSDLQPKGVSS
ncbi:ARMT1-like domain-containing protein [Pontiellaceae bacterium B12219]|nr:ARMT1-like domain-containing protein [Pontiellaceae bacterium B12219]